MGFLTFMGEHPFLTFFLACITGTTIVNVTRIIAEAIRGHCNDCACGDTTDDVR